MHTMRLHTLDYLRGLMAIGIMVYHYVSWTLTGQDSSTFLGKIGIYGVSTFYVLSGLTLYIVYKDNLTLSTTKSFFLKRFFRIYPLMWLCIILNIVLFNKSFGIEKLVLNFTGAFGFVSIDQYIVTGAWSIGNELVFYCIFPAVIILSTRYKYTLDIFFSISILVALVFAYSILDAKQALSKQWVLYINPFNQLFLFAGGMYLAKLLEEKKNTRYAWGLVVFSMLVLLFFPSTSNQINIVTGFERIMYASTSFALTAAFLLFRGAMKSKVFIILGQISYSVYLMHPIVFWEVNKYIKRKEEPVLFLTIGFITTIIVSYFVYHLLEKQVVKLGKHIITKWEQPRVIRNE